MDELRDMILKRDELEKEISDLSIVLLPYEEKNLHKNLVDDEGFPRADLDYGKLVEYRTHKKKQNGIV